MMNYIFEWDVNKAKLNLAKHNVRFDIAASIFKDPFALTIYDDEHSEYEDRWITIGLSYNSQLIVVVHTFNMQINKDAIIRIISARKATKNEVRTYKGDI